MDKHCPFCNHTLKKYTIPEWYSCEHCQYLYSYDDVTQTLTARGMILQGVRLTLQDVSGKITPTYH